MASLLRFTPNKSVILVGLMGAGKSCIGELLAKRLCLPFVDADEEIEKAAGCSIAEIFDKYGENEFRSGESRVIKRLLMQPIQIIAAGGGAFMDNQTREAIRQLAISIWLKVDLEVLVSRTMRRDHRPLLRGRSHRDTLQRLLIEREPLYETADLIVESGAEAPKITVTKICKALKNHKVKDSPNEYVQ
ncbi:MAG: shikimate kinase [Pseudomonadota bacterium]|nr:shikimate kinase [Pseudomonadota bacterium]